MTLLSRMANSETTEIILWVVSVRPTPELSGAPLAAPPLEAELGIAYALTLARAAQARAVNEIDPFASVGRRSCIRSRRRALAVSSSDMA
jgi:hypothetical protein